MTDKIRFGIVGFGHIGKRHAEVIEAHPLAELVAICDTAPACECVPSRWQHIPYYHNHLDLLNAETLDVVCVATPNGLHATHALAALRRGCHVVIEKPMALTKTDCESVIFEALQRNLHVFCVMQNRYSPPAQWLYNLVHNHTLGAIKLVDIRCYWNRDARYYRPQGLPHPWKGTKALDGGVLFTQFSHFVDMMYWLFGDITDIRARSFKLNPQPGVEFDDSGLVSFRFTKGGVGQISYTTSVFDKNLESSLTVIGERGTVRVGGQYMNEVTYCHIQDYRMPPLADTAPPNNYGGYTGSAANHHFVINNVVETITGRAHNSTNALEGMKIVDIIERIYGAHA